MPNAIDKLKHHVDCILMLKIFDGALDTWVEVRTDASAKVLGNVLLQKCSAANHFCPTLYYNKKFNNAKQN